MRHLEIYEGFESVRLEDISLIVQMIHITTPAIAGLINEVGFDPKGSLKWNYYSALGEDGIFFYPKTFKGRRYAQAYAYALLGHKRRELKDGKVAVIYCEAPWSIVKSNLDKVDDVDEDGWFIEKKDLGRVTVNKIEFAKPVDIT